MLRTLLSSGLVLASAVELATAQDGIWVNRLAAPGVVSCTGQLLGFDTQRRETVWFGEQSCQQTWVWDGAVWTQRTTSVAPPAEPCVGVYDSVRHRIVATFGGFSSPMQTWEWDGSVWQHCQTGSPPPRYSYGLAFDAARNVTVLFGGRDG